MEKYFIIYRTGGVYDQINGTREEVQTECDRLNETDEQGTTVILSEFSKQDERDDEFDRLTTTLF